MKHTKKFHSFVGEKGVSIQLICQTIFCHFTWAGGEGIKGNFASVTKSAGFFLNLH